MRFSLRIRQSGWTSASQHLFFVFFNGYHIIILDSKFGEFENCFMNEEDFVEQLGIPGYAGLTRNFAGEETYVM